VGIERPDHVEHEARLAQLHRRQVDRNPDIGGPFARLGAGLAQDPVAELADQPGFLGDRNELRRRNGAAGRMLPAHQRLGADDGMGLDLQDGLEDQLELAARDRQAADRARSLCGPAPAGTFPR